MYFHKNEIFYFLPQFIKKETKNKVTNLVVLLVFCGTLIGFWLWNKYRHKQDCSMVKSIVEMASSNEGGNIPSEKILKKYGFTGILITDKGLYGFKSIDDIKGIRGTIKGYHEKNKEDHGTIITSHGIISNGVFTPME